MINDTFKVCWIAPDSLGSYPIELGQDEDTNLFAVKYGVQVDTELTYGQACTRLGAAIMHALACEYLIDNSEPGDDQ